MYCKGQSGQNQNGKTKHVYSGWEQNRVIKVKGRIADMIFLLLSPHSNMLHAQHSSLWMVQVIASCDAG